MDNHIVTTISGYVATPAGIVITLIVVALLCMLVSGQFRKGS